MKLLWLKTLDIVALPYLLIDSGDSVKYLGHSKIDETLNAYSHMYQNRLDAIKYFKKDKMIDI